MVDISKVHIQKSKYIQQDLKNNLIRFICFKLIWNSRKLTIYHCIKCRPVVLVDQLTLSRDGVRDENLSGQVIMQGFVAAEQRLLFCQNWAYSHPAHPLLPYLLSQPGVTHYAQQIATSTPKFSDLPTALNYI